MLRGFIHYGFHFLIPILVAYLFYKKDFKRAVIILIGAIIIDVDHLLASPIFDPNRCSIGFHPLHSYMAIGCYVALLFFRETRIFGVALLLHMTADTLDCLMK
ncbi:hypothetical protein NBRC110019_13530 [Neptunitalea chrysea]|uniref:Uncharacterized protein n=1 Tax=Neptunitalea chrysea TaxID=1647581 RepID=A0A9W6B4B9_9FLAO|nr:DUF6122 family protein [Neptunitalea chrysea]GLB52314.1 hypothetical protein NBRC110019_13530 [Neptunitalea chrysea]